MSGPRLFLKQAFFDQILGIRVSGFSGSRNFCANPFEICKNDQIISLFTSTAECEIFVTKIHS